MRAAISRRAASSTVRRRVVITGESSGGAAASGASLRRRAPRAASPSPRGRRRRPRPRPAPSTPGPPRRSPPRRRGSRARRGSAASAARRRRPGPRRRRGSASAGTCSRRVARGAGRATGSPCRSTDGAHPAGQPRAQPLGVRIGLGREDLGHHGPRRRHRERVAEDRAARRDEVRALPVRALALVEERRRSRRSCPTRRTGGRRRSTCRSSTKSGSRPHAAVSPPGPDDLGVGLVDRQQRAGLAGQAPQLGVEARRRAAGGRCCS